MKFRSLFNMLHLDFDIDMFTIYVVIVLSILLFIYIFWDVNYFIRTIIVIVYGRFFLEKLKLDEICTIYGICTTQDLDILFRHMNNGRFARDLDFARFSFYDRTNLHRVLVCENAQLLQRATNIRYRRVIPLFSLYKVTTKLIYWTEDSIYLENQFITLSDGFIRAVVVNKQSVVGANMRDIIPKMLGKDKDYKLEAPEELDLWIKSMEVSSARLKKSE